MSKTVSLFDTSIITSLDWGLLFKPRKFQWKRGTRQTETHFRKTDEGDTSVTWSFGFSWPLLPLSWQSLVSDLWNKVRRPCFANLLPRSTSEHSSNVAFLKKKRPHHDFSRPCLSCFSTVNVQDLFRHSSVNEGYSNVILQSALSKSYILKITILSKDYKYGWSSLRTTARKIPVWKAKSRVNWHQKLCEQVPQIIIFRLDAKSCNRTMINDASRQSTLSTTKSDTSWLQREWM